MLTIKVFLAASGEIAELKKDFPLFKGAYNDKLLNVYVPTEILSADFKAIDSAGATVSNLVNGTTVSVGLTAVRRNGGIFESKKYSLCFVKKLVYQGVEYALFERKLPKAFTSYVGQGTNAPKMVINVADMQLSSIVLDTSKSAPLTNVTVNKSIWESKVSVGGEYTFVYRNNGWTMGNIVNIDLSTYGLSFVGTPVTNTTIGVLYTPANLQELITSQTCSFDVENSCELNEEDALEPTAQDELFASINSINETLAQKQDINSLQLETTSKQVVGGINENKNRIDTNTDNIAQNTSDISQALNDISYLKQNIVTGENFVGQLTGETLPTDEELTSFVQQEMGRAPKAGDVIIFILTSETETDRNYKYYYTAAEVQEWQGYEIPAVQQATNKAYGIIKGTYDINSTSNMQIDVVGGEILHIWLKDASGEARELREYLNSTNTTIGDIISGDTSVGNALKAVADQYGNNIVNTYLTNAVGATKQYVRDYSMPRIFNDVKFIATSGYVQSAPTTPDSGIQFTVETSSVGDYELFEISKAFGAELELSAKNGYSNNIFVSASEDCTVTFRLTTQYKKVGADWEDLNVELTSPITMTAGDIQKITFANPFSYLGEQVITLDTNDLLQQSLSVVTQTSTPITFDVYSNEIYPSIFNLTSQSYTLAEVSEDIGKHIQLGVDCVIESGRVVGTVKDADSFLEYRTHLREFFMTMHLPVVVPTFQSLDATMPVAITFGDTAYNLYNYMLGSNAPLTIGNLMSVASYDQNIGFFFNFKATFFETSDLVGFCIIPPAIIAKQIDNIIEDSPTVVTDLDSTGTKLSIHLSNDVNNKLAKALVTPMVAPTSTELVGIGTNGMQANIDLGESLEINNNTIDVSPNAPFVSTNPQELTEEQKAQARSNIGAGSGSFTGAYEDLSGKPTLNTTSETSLETGASETIEGNISLHKISKTGLLADTIKDDDNQTVTTAEKQQISTNAANISDLDNDIQNINTELDKLLPKTGGTVDGDLTVTGSLVGQNVMAGSLRTLSSVTTSEQDYVLVTDAQGNVYKRAMANVLDDIGGSTILNNGVRQDTFDISTVVQTTGNQSIGGTKNFTGIFQINGGVISYDPTTDTFNI